MSTPSAQRRQCRIIHQNGQPRPLKQAAKTEGNERLPTDEIIPPNPSVGRLMINNWKSPDGDDEDDDGDDAQGLGFASRQNHSAAHIASRSLILSFTTP